MNQSVLSSKKEKPCSGADCKKVYAQAINTPGRYQTIFNPVLAA